MSATAAQVRRVAWLAVVASILGLTALAMGCDDGQQRHQTEEGKRAVYVACMPDVKYRAGVACAILAEDGSRLNAYFDFPVMEGDTVYSDRWVARDFK